MATNRMFALASAVLHLGLSVAEPVNAQSYPEKPIKIIVPAAPGSPNDFPARLAAQILTPKLGQPVVVENRLGAGGAIAAREVAKARPDGYTLLMGNTSTLAFLAVFRLVCPGAGVALAILAGYGAALGVLTVIHWASNGPSLDVSRNLTAQPIRLLGRIVWRSAAESLPWPRGMHWRPPGAHVRGVARDRARRRRAHRCGFAPLVETLAW